MQLTIDAKTEGGRTMAANRGTALNPSSEAVRDCISEMETPLCTVEDLLEAIIQLTEDLNIDNRTIVDRLARIASSECDKLREEWDAAFRAAAEARREAAAMKQRPADTATVHDPLVDAIKAYHDGMAAYGHIAEKDWPLHGGEMAVVHKTYGAPLDALAEWGKPARTREGAIAALRFVIEEQTNYWSTEAACTMTESVLAYLIEGGNEA